MWALYHCTSYVRVTSSGGTNQTGTYSKSVLEVVTAHKQVILPCLSVCLSEDILQPWSALNPPAPGRPEMRGSEGAPRRHPAEEGSGA